MSLTYLARAAHGQRIGRRSKASAWPVSAIAGVEVYSAGLADRERAAVAVGALGVTRRHALPDHGGERLRSGLATRRFPALPVFAALTELARVDPDEADLGAGQLDRIPVEDCSSIGQRLGEAGAGGEQGRRHQDQAAHAS